MKYSDLTEAQQEKIERRFRLWEDKLNDPETPQAVFSRTDARIDGAHRMLLILFGKEEVDKIYEKIGV